MISTGPAVRSRRQRTLVEHVGTLPESRRLARDAACYALRWRPR